MVADTLSKSYILLSNLNARLLGFEHLKELYPIDSDFSTMYSTCGKSAFDKFYRHDEFLFCEGKLCIPNCSIRELFVCESYSGGLMEHFGIAKTLDILNEHFFWPHMKRNVERVCCQCITCKQAKSIILPQGLYIYTSACA